MERERSNRIQLVVHSMLRACQRLWSAQCRGARTPLPQTSFLVPDGRYRRSDHVCPFHWILPVSVWMFDTGGLQHQDSCHCAGSAALCNLFCKSVPNHQIITIAHSLISSLSSLLLCNVTNTAATEHNGHLCCVWWLDISFTLLRFICQLDIITLSVSSAVSVHTCVSSLAFCLS